MDYPWNQSFPLISNIYCNLMERKIIKKWKENNIIISYHRYVDDIFICVRKGHFKKILFEMNNYDKGYLEFKVEPMVDNKLNFLDTQYF